MVILTWWNIPTRRKKIFKRKKLQRACWQISGHWESDDLGIVYFYTPRWNQTLSESFPASFYDTHRDVEGSPAAMGVNLVLRV